VYFLDYTMGCGWWVMVLYLIQIFAIFIVRGRPYSADRVASALFPKRDCTSGQHIFPLKNHFYALLYYQWKLLIFIVRKKILGVLGRATRRFYFLLIIIFFISVF
jgi:hypothetical protein